jgi:phosphoribosylformimino-5-aminoimidazole carboxamide ribotide isomerase
VELYPAIDIRAGRVVRVRRGDPGSEIVYHHDPLAVAEGYARDGARWIHVVDLDRVVGSGDQTALIADLVRRVPLNWQVGGGVTTAGEAEALFACGISRVIVRAGAPSEGAAGLEDLARRCGGSRLAVALDVAGESAGGALRGTRALDPPGAEALARAAAAAGIATVVYTDLGLEGRLGGTDVSGAAALARAAGVEVVVSGGVHSLDEISRIRAAGLAGAVVGRALFEGRFTLREALACSSR